MKKAAGTCMVLTAASVLWFGIHISAGQIIDDKMVIQGAREQRIDAEKKPLEHAFNIDDILTFDLEPVKNIYYYHAVAPQDDTQVALPVQEPMSPISDVVVRDIITGPPLKMFNPEPLNRAKTWVLTVLDAQGNAIKRFTSGAVKPSQEGIAWDGRDTKGVILRAGYPYSYIFEWSVKNEPIDPSGDVAWRDNGLYKQTETGETFSLQAICYPENGRHAVVMTHERLYPGQDEEEDSFDQGMLDQAAVLVRDNFIDTVSITVHDADAAKALCKAEQIKKNMAERLILPEKHFSAHGRNGQDNRPYTEIVF